MINVLLSWIGKTDLDEISQYNTVSRGGPIASLLTHPLGQPFEEVHLLSCEYDMMKIDEYLSQLNKLTTTRIAHHRQRLVHPMDHESIYKAAEDLIRTIKKNFPACRFAYHLSPGTNAMAAIWMLIGRTHTPGEFYRTWISSVGELEVVKVDIPFRISLESYPEIIREASSQMLYHWQEIPEFAAIQGQTQSIIEAKEKAARAAQFDVPVLITGESGTGKEIIARAIHSASQRKSSPFLAINCAAIPENLAESELFGYKKGAFSDAYRDKNGAFSQCEGGSLFLDEIGELPSLIQTKLLRVLQDKKFIPLGAQTEQSCNVRILAATNRPLSSMQNNGSFRLDLFHRLAVAVIELPPLRERGHDIEMIAHHLVDTINEEFMNHIPSTYQYQSKRLSGDAISWIKRQLWPGNIRELGNLLRRTFLWNNEQVITEENLKKNHFFVDSNKINHFILPESGIDLDAEMLEIEKNYVQQALKIGGSKARAAELLGLNSKTFISRCNGQYAKK